MSLTHGPTVLLSITFLLSLLAPPAVAVPQQPDSAAVARAVAHFHQSLASGDSAAALALLAPDFVVAESGGIETLAEYRAHHLPADIEFARSVGVTHLLRSVRVEGNVAWVVSESTSSGSFRGRPIRSAGAELVVLTRDGGRWRIRAVHWSSHAIRREG